MLTHTDGSRTVDPDAFVVTFNGPDTTVANGSSREYNVRVFRTAMGTYSTTEDRAVCYFSVRAVVAAVVVCGRDVQPLTPPSGPVAPAVPVSTTSIATTVSGVAGASVDLLQQVISSPIVRISPPDAYGKVPLPSVLLPPPASSAAASSVTAGLSSEAGCSASFPFPAHLALRPMAVASTSTSSASGAVVPLSEAFPFPAELALRPTAPTHSTTSQPSAIGSMSHEGAAIQVGVAFPVVGTSRLDLLAASLPVLAVDLFSLFQHHHLNKNTRV